MLLIALLLKETEMHTLNRQIPINTLNSHNLHRFLWVSAFLVLSSHNLLADTSPDPLPLHTAVERADRAVLEKLIAKGESLDRQGSDGWTPLMYAVRDGRQETVSILLAAGAAVNIGDRWSRTPLHLAAEAPAGIARMLIKAGADLDKRNAGGVTPLMLAAGNGRQDIVELLLQAGARLDLKDYQDNSVVDWARRSQNPELTRKLEHKLSTASEQPSRARTENFAEDVFVDVKFPDWFKPGFLDLDVDLQEALSAGKQGLMIFISTRRCSYCKAFIENSLALPDIRRRVQESFDVVGLEIFDDSMMTDPEGNRYRVKEFVTVQKATFTPTLIFYGPQGQKILKIVGYYPPDKFRTVLDYLQGKRYQHEPLRDYISRVSHSSQTSAAQIKKDYELFSKPPYMLDRRAGPAQRPLLVLFEQPDCSACERFHNRVLADEAIRRLMGRFEVVQLDASDTATRLITPTGDRVTPKEWFAGLDLSYRPALVFFSEMGEEVMRLDSETQRYRMEGTLQLVLEKGYENDAQLQRWRRDKAVELYNMQNKQK